MNAIDYKHFVFELISAIRGKFEMLEVEQKVLSKKDYETMKIAYDYVIDDLISLMKELGLDIENYGFNNDGTLQEDFKPKQKD